jgi:hypothetical protein
VGSNPTLSAITSFVPSLAVIYRPTRAWQALRAARPGWLRCILVQVLPLALFCALAWPFASTVVLVVVAVLTLALGFFVVSPWFDVPRSWDGCAAVAAYASTPVMVAWGLLAYPPFAILPIVALLHSFALGYLGVQEVLGCREEEAALLVAAAWVFSAVGSMVIGALCGAAGFL